MLVTLTGASGVGKTSIMKRLLAERRDCHLLPSFTTRAPRPSDAEGEYTYLTPEEYRIHCAVGDFAWKLDFASASYGTRHADLRFALASLEIFLAAIVPGHIALVREFAAVEGFATCLRSIYIQSPDRRVLARRMTEGRGEPPEVADRKIEECSRWDQEAARSRHYLFVKDNDDFDESYRNVQELIDRPW